MVFYLFGSIIFLLVIYVMVIRPVHLKWGSTQEELEYNYPGDTIVSDPDFNAVRAITINAKPEDIWPWIVQIGSGKAGWYSIDMIDNGGIKSSESILPEYQYIEIGQFIPFTPDRQNGMWVKDYEKSKFILWTDQERMATWLWYLFDKGDATRLITKLRTKYKWRSIWIIYYLIYDIGDIIMMKKCMKGIKGRVETPIVYGNK